MNALVANRGCFDPLPQALGKQVRMSPPLRKNIGQLFKSYAENLTKLQAMDTQIEQFAKNLVSQNMGLSVNVFCPTLMPSAELAVKSYEFVCEALNNGLQGALTEITMKVVSVLDELVRQHQIGLIQWFNEQVCRFYFYTFDHTDKTTTQRQGDYQMQRTERTHVQQVHVHDVIEAGRIPYPAKNVRMPDRVRKIINATPTFLQSFMFVVTGNEICKRVAEVNRKVEVFEQRFYDPLPTYGPDPALVLGSYVLAGW